MEHGGQQFDQSTTSFEIVNPPENGGETSQVAITTVNPATQEAKERVLKRIEQGMEIFRKGECTRFQASSRVAKELEGWEGSSDKEKGKAFDSYLAEINSFAAIQDEARSATRGTPPPLGTSLVSGRQPTAKRIREEVEELLDQVSRGDLDGEPEENEQRVIRKRAREEDMPWYNPSSNLLRRSSCVKTSTSANSGICCRGCSNHRGL